MAETKTYREALREAMVHELDLARIRVRLDRAGLNVPDRVDGVEIREDLRDTPAGDPADRRGPPG